MVIAAAVGLSGLSLGMAALQCGHYVAHRRFPGLGLHADYFAIRGTDLGLGAPVFYGARLTNYGPAPVPVSRCAFLTDTCEPGVTIAFALEGWDARAKSWIRLVQISAADVCESLPTSRGKGRFERRWLWPGQSLTTVDLVPASWFGNGRLARFAVFTAIPAVDGIESSVKTTPFVVVDR